MSNLQADQLIARLAERIGREYKPQKVILFGSYAYGEYIKDALTKMNDATPR